MMKPQVTPEIKIPRELRGWSLYEASESSPVSLIYGHDDGGWAVVRPVNGGPELLVYHEDGELGDEALETLDVMLQFVLTGTRGLDAPIQDVTIEGDVSDAYEEAAIK